MTLDELLTQLMKIKEVYPDSGSFVIYVPDCENGIDFNVKAEKVMKLTNGNSIVIE